MRSRDVTKFVQLAYSTLPRDVLVTVENRSLPGGLEPDDWALMRRVLDLIKANVDSNAGPGEVFDVIETALRAHYAKPIDRHELTLTSLSLAPQLKEVVVTIGGTLEDDLGAVHVRHGLHQCSKLGR